MINICVLNNLIEFVKVVSKLPSSALDNFVLVYSLDSDIRQI